MKAKKSLGQHFLKSKEALRLIVAAAMLKKGDAVLEVGPGKGILTAELLKEGSKVIAVEKDNELIDFLNDRFAAEIAEERLTLINGDILDYNPESLGLTSGRYKLVANIPYYITGALIRKFLGASAQPERIVLLIQKEVADRIVA